MLLTSAHFPCHSDSKGELAATVVPKFAGSNPAEAVGFFRASFGGEVSRRSHVADLRHVTEPFIGVEFTGNFSPIVPPFPARGLSRCYRRGGSWWRKRELSKSG
jgi:hypothetical protein